eukprot:SAG11_NODE_126_length_15729_cov_9.966859_20_plen_165_part_00
MAAGQKTRYLGSYWVSRNSAKFSDGGFFFRYLLWVLRILSSDRVLACIRAIPYGYSGKSRTYKNFEKLIPQNFACSRLWGTTVRKTNCKMVPLSFYYRVFRSPIKFLPDVQGKKSIDTKAQKLLRPVLESAAQGLSRTISCVMVQVHSKIPISHNSAPPSTLEF